MTQRNVSELRVRKSVSAVGLAAAAVVEGLESRTLLSNAGLGAWASSDPSQAPMVVAPADPSGNALAAAGTSSAPLLAMAGPLVVVSIPDAGLQAAILSALGKPAGYAITSADMASLTSLTAEDAGISDLTGLQYAVNLQTLNLIGNQISDVTALSGLTWLTDLRLGDNQISDVTPLVGMTQLTQLDLSYNQISDVTPLAGLTQLTGLYLSSNQISDVMPLSGLTQLTFLDVGSNQISDLTPLVGMTQLTQLDLYYDQISNVVPLAGLTQLTVLDLSSNQISDVTPLSGLTQLTFLDLSYNQISDLTPLVGMTQLTQLVLYYNQISNVVPLAGLTQLTSLELDSNQISDVAALAGLTQLTYLSLGSNQISDVTPLAGLTKLQNLHLPYNQISDVTALSGLTQLTYLGLSYNQISDVTPLADLTQLPYLDLSSNQISDVTPLAGMTQLSWLDLTHNNLDISSGSPAMTVIQSLQQQGTSVDYLPQDIPTETAVSSSSANPTYGQLVTLTATVSSASGIPAGTVTFLDGTTVLGTGILDSTGTATLPLPGLPAGSHSITASYAGNSPDEGSTSDAMGLVVNKAVLSISIAPESKIYGQVNPTPSGIISGVVNGDGITASYAYVSAAPTQFSDPGSDPIIATLNDPNHKLSNYTVSNPGGTLNIFKANQTITWTTPAAITYGTALSSTQLDATVAGVVGGSAAGALTYNPVMGAVLNAGSQTLSVSAAATTDYNAATGSTSITVNKATPTISWVQPTPIPYGTALSSGQLDATASFNGVAVPGTYAYTPSSGTILTAGANQTLSVVFTPTDTTDYTMANGSTAITVNQATPGIIWTAPTAITYGTALSATQLDATANVPGTFVYTPVAATVLNAGANQTLSVVFTPTDTTDYTMANGSTAITVNQAKPVITWTAPTAITYGTALSTTQLDATANIPGTFVYTPAVGTLLSVGSNQTLNVVFTPTDTTDYTTANASTAITVNQAKPVITWTAPTASTYGTPLSSTQLNATANVPGTFVYTPVAATVLNAGANQTLSVVFTPTDSTNYNVATDSVPLTVIPLRGGFGMVNGKLQKLMLPDASGDQVTFTLKGGGTGQVFGAATGFQELVLSDTTNKSVFSVTVKKAAGSSGMVTMGGISCAGLLKSVNASAVNLSGEVQFNTSNLIAGKASLSLKFRQISDADITVQGLPVASIVVGGTVSDSRMVTTASIGKFTAAALLDSDILVGAAADFSGQFAGSASDFTNPAAKFGSLTVSGQKQPKVQSNPADVAGSDISAPSVGTVSLVNVPAGSGTIVYVLNDVGTLKVSQTKSVTEAMLTSGTWKKAGQRPAIWGVV